MSIEATQVVLLKQTYTPHSRRMLTYKKKQNAPNKERLSSNQPKNWPDAGEASPTTRSLEWWRICDLELRCERVRPHSYSGAQNSHLQMLATTSLCYKIRANRLYLIMRESAESFRLRIGIGVGWQKSGRHKPWGNRALNGHLHPLQSTSLSKLRIIRIWNMQKVRDASLQLILTEDILKGSYWAPVLMLTFWV